MKNFRDILIEHASRYPHMTGRDAAKLIFQSEYGMGHILSSSFHKRLMEEYESLKALPCDTKIEDIGNGVCRVYLPCLDVLEVSALSKLCVDGAENYKIVPEGYDKKLYEAEILCREGFFNFDSSELEEFRVPSVIGHSKRYREEYRPAYRVLPMMYALFLPLFSRLERDLSEGMYISIGIDGMCGSGKSTLCDIIQRVYGTEAVRMDDFFLPPELRTPERLNSPGGNVHSERFILECAEGIRTGKGFSYRIFDCSIMDYNGEKKIPPSNLRLTEGSYCLHPAHGDIYTVRVFLKLSSKEQSRRILLRNGKEMHKMFIERWIPMENRYFEHFGIEKNADFVICADV